MTLKRQFRKFIPWQAVFANTLIHIVTKVFFNRRET